MPYCRIPRVSDTYPHPGLFRFEPFRLIILINNIRNLLWQHVNVIIKLTLQVRPNSPDRYSGIHV